MGQTKTYFGQIEEIWELDYSGDLQLAVFWCQWVKPKGVVVDDCGLTTVELQSVGYKDDQWVLATEVTQVAYYVMLEDNRRHYQRNMVDNLPRGMPMVVDESMEEREIQTRW